MKSKITFNHELEQISDAFGIKQEEFTEINKLITKALLDSDESRLSSLVEEI